MYAEIRKLFRSNTVYLIHHTRNNGKKQND